MAIVGIDLGTTNSCVAICREGETDVLENNFGKRTTPSFLAYTQDGWIYGEEAKDQITLNPANTFFDMKRLLGREFADECVQNDIKYWPFKVVDDHDQIAVQIEGESPTKLCKVQEITAKFLKHLKTQAENALGEEIQEAVITVPAYFNDRQRNATIEAGRIAGLKVRHIINEPTAAGIAYQTESEAVSQRKMLVYDLGGGTFDVSIIAYDGKEFVVKATAGDAHLGGEDFDDQLVKECLRDINERLKNSIKNNPSAMQRLRTACENAKCILSARCETTIDLESLDEEEDFHKRITRARFEEINSNLFQKTIDIVQKTLENANLRPENIDDVLLVGGSTRVPKVQEMLISFFNNRRLNHCVNPDEAVAIGAAKVAASFKPELSLTEGPKTPQSEIPNPKIDYRSSLSEPESDQVEGHRRDELIVLDGPQPLVIRDLVPFSLCVQVRNRKTDTIIPRYTNVPIKRTKRYRTTNDNQSCVRISIYEGESGDVDHSHRLGEFVLSGITQAPKGQVNILVAFQIDLNGIFKVTATEDHGEAKKEITIMNDAGRLSEEEIRRLTEQN
ncbi:unnamed protein product [Calicophoron daubneyi]|uniref:Heat shock protein 70 n=1 Tax=Calicophoron daubneyi TaxID=300641 RepID=A0AAV2TRT1_CALDB